MFKRTVCMVWALALLGGCGTAAPGGGGSGGAHGDREAEAGEPLTSLGTNEPSPLEPGIYEGDMACVVTLSTWDGQDLEDTQEYPQGLVISDSGFPVTDGQESLPGASDSLAVAGETLTATVTNVLTNQDGVVVIWDVTLPTERCRLRGEVEEVYRLSGENGVALQMAVNLDCRGPEWVSFTGSCSGDFHRDDKGTIDEPEPDDEAVEPAGESDDAELDEDNAAPVGSVQEATWLVLYGSDVSLYSATAFAVGPDVLATNAHVVEGILAIMGEPNAAAIVVQHETGTALPVTTLWTHPAFVQDAFAFTPDLGLLGVDGELPSFLELADDTALQSLQVFDTVSLCGFPGDVTAGIDLVGVSTGEFHPRVTCLRGTISALRPFDPGDAATPENSLLIQYDLPVTPGTSGSAVFNDAGEVVGVNSFGFFQSGGDYNFAIRADKLAELIELVADGELAGTDLVAESAPPPDEAPSDTVPTAPCDTSYYNSDWRFGLDVPSEFGDPEVISSPVLFAVEFTHDDSEYTTVKAEVRECYTFDLDYQVDLWIDILGSGGLFELLTKDQFVTVDGSPAYLLSWVFPSSLGEDRFDILSVESWTLGEYGVYVVTVNAFRDDYVLLDPTPETIAQSICTD